MDTMCVIVLFFVCIIAQPYAICFIISLSQELKISIAEVLQMTADISFVIGLPSQRL